MAQTSIITFDGKLDNLVGFKNNKGTYSLRKRIKPANPNTIQQRAQRAKFTAVSKLEQLLRPQLFGLKPAANQDKISLRNEFMKLNIGVCENVGMEDGGFKVQLLYDNVTVAKGNGRPISKPQFQADIPGTVIFTYSANSLGDSDLDDPVHLVGIIGDMERVYHAQAKRRDGQLALENLPANTAGKTMTLYHFTQHFNTPAAQAVYDSYLSTNQAEAIGWLFESASNSIFSNSNVGRVTLS